MGENKEEFQNDLIRFLSLLAAAARRRVDGARVNRHFVRGLPITVTLP